MSKDIKNANREATANLLNKQKKDEEHAKVHRDIHKLLLPQEAPPPPAPDAPPPKKGPPKYPKGFEMLKRLFPSLDLSQPLDPNGPKPKMVPLEMKRWVRKAKVVFPADKMAIIQEIRARRKARSCGASFSRTGSMDVKDMVCTPSAPPSDGVFQIRRPDGTPVLYVEYAGGKMHGVQKKFLGGQLSEVSHYKHGKLHGVMQTFSEEGLCTRKFTYKNGALNGEMVQYDKSGEPLMRTNFLDNKQHGVCVVYTQGYMVSRASFVKGKKQGMMRSFFPPTDPKKPQQVSKETFFLNDLMDGPSYTYYPSGKKYMEENFVKNIKEGPTLQYFDNGNVQKISMFSKNKLTGKPDEYDYFGKRIKS
jgi:antitoxin component YwqK of YwqJK toxin-antitoxin module